MRTFFLSAIILALSCGGIAVADTQNTDVEVLTLPDGTKATIPTVASIATQARKCESLKDPDVANLCMSWAQEATEKAGAAKYIAELVSQMGSGDHLGFMFSSSTHARTRAAEAMAKLESLQNLSVRTRTDTAVR